MFFVPDISSTAEGTWRILRCCWGRHTSFHVWRNARHSSLLVYRTTTWTVGCVCVVFLVKVQAYHVRVSKFLLPVAEISRFHGSMFSICSDPSTFKFVLNWSLVRLINSTQSAFWFPARLFDVPGLTFAYVNTQESTLLSVSRITVRFDTILLTRTFHFIAH